MLKDPKHLMTLRTSLKMYQGETVSTLWIHVLLNANLTEPSNHAGINKLICSNQIV